MKEGLRNQFEKILSSPDVDYFGNVVVGKEGDFKLDDLRALGFQAILVTVGAQGTKWLGLPGENLKGVYHAKELVYHYNNLPPFSQWPFSFGKRVAVVGVGNVMMDIARYFIRERKVDEVIAVARRGPAEVKFDKKEFEVVGANVDQTALDAEIARVTPLMQAVGQNPADAKADINAGLPHAQPKTSDTRFTFQFLTSPTRMIGDADNRVIGLEVEDNALVMVGNDTKAKGLGTKRVLDCDTVIFAIGDQVDGQFGLPVMKGEFAKNPTPRFPVENVSYESFDPTTNQPLDGIFLAGWARQASTGLVGTARKDGESGAKAILQYLATQPALTEINLRGLQHRLDELNKPIVTKKEIAELKQIEREQAKQRGLEEFKFASNDEMLNALKLVTA
jgi:ferredoxin--NADP+ reductase